MYQIYIVDTGRCFMSVWVIVNVVSLILRAIKTRLIACLWVLYFRVFVPLAVIRYTSPL